MSSKPVERLSSEYAGNQEIQDDNKPDCEYDECCEPFRKPKFRKSKTDGRALAMDFENRDSGRFHLVSCVLPAPLRGHHNGDLESTSLEAHARA